MNKLNIAIIGGDRRISKMALKFAQKGFTVNCFGIADISDIKNTAYIKNNINNKGFSGNYIHFCTSLKEAVISANIIICGIPFTKNGTLYFENNNIKIQLSELENLLKKEQLLFGGVIPTDFKEACSKKGVTCFDFMENEAITIFNTTATAEGAILEALLHKDTELHLSKTLVLGYGRCGKVLADKLKGLSAFVTVCSNVHEELALASSFGFRTLNLSDLPEKIASFEYIFNTIPAQVLTKDCLEQMAENALVIDIASNKIGVDYEAASHLGRNVLFCPGLPGKYASESCAVRLCEFVINKLNELT